jgi:hypothetical protein
MDRTSAAKKSKSFAIGGTGLCPEAQADGVPCTALGRDCEVCEKAGDWLEAPEGPASPFEMDEPTRPVR